jgi:hypothetical protein
MFATVLHRCWHKIATAAVQLVSGIMAGHLVDEVEVLEWGCRGLTLQQLLITTTRHV